MMPHPSRSDAGFSLPEVLVSMGIMLVVLAGTFTAMTNAMKAEESARGITTLNGHLRSSMDVLVRDLLQVGQGLQVGRVVGIPNGTGATAIIRPGPVATGACAGVTPFPLSPTLSAVTVGPDLGPPINGQCTDVITTLALDGAFERVTVDAIAANAQSITINAATNISDNPDVNGDNVRIGDFLEIRRGTVAVIAAVTDVTGQTVTFAPGDPNDTLGLNQFGAGLNNSMTQVAAAPVAGGTQANRVRMITYYVDTTSSPASPRLVRQINGQPPNAVAFELEAFRLTYDLANGVTNPANVRMDATDLGTTGRCSPSPCSPNQIRKANVTLAIRSEKRNPSAGYYHNTLFTQVALRSLAFVDRYD
jgi:prepilin-type N-terminal cleavage/methylation domain-containing protein